MSNKSGYMNLVTGKTIRKKKGDGESIIGIKHNYNADAAPTASDDITQGYAAGSEWIINEAGDATDGDVYKCTDGAEGAANWEQVHDATP